MVSGTLCIRVVRRMGGFLTRSFRHGTLSSGESLASFQCVTLRGEGNCEAGRVGNPRLRGQTTQHPVFSFRQSGEGRKPCWLGESRIIFKYPWTCSKVECIIMSSRFTRLKRDNNRRKL